METQQRDLERELERTGWRIVARHDGEEWWVHEFWEIESRWRPAGARGWITFLVDPLDEPSRRPQPRVWAVGVTASRPRERADVEAAAVPVRHGWSAHLEMLMASVAKLRD